MRFGVIGAGNIGSTLAGSLTRLGHEVALSNSRGPDSLADTVARLGGSVRAMTPEDAARFGDIVVEAIPFGQHRHLPRTALSGKLLVSASNFFPQRDGGFDVGERAHTELVADFLRDTTVVKAFNTIHWVHLRDQGNVAAALDDRRVVLLAGDDVAAKDATARMIEELGFGPLDVGSLGDSRIQEPDTYLFNRDLTLAEARAWLQSRRT